jgi:hypothetical protein
MTSSDCCSEQIPLISAGADLRGVLAKAGQADDPVASAFVVMKRRSWPKPSGRVANNTGLLFGLLNEAAELDHHARA